MNWPQAISRNQAALLAVVVAIIALIGGREGGAIARHLRNAALALLRPAEAAARRLIVIAARDIAPLRARPFSGALGPRQDSGPSSVIRPPAFRLFDPPKRFELLAKTAPSGIPRIRTFWGPQPATAASPPPATLPLDPDAPVDSASLRLRLGALERALGELPRQARRWARWRARPDMRARSPLRPGPPPGHCQWAGRDVDLVLRDCHALALGALAADTS
jgi:hypothetical protein